MIMMQQAFNDILLNVTQANDLISNETTSNSSKSFFESTQIIMDNTNSNSTLTSSILKNNFFSNLVANDYLLDNKENYNLNDGTPSSMSLDKLKSSPLSSGLSSLSSSLTSSSSSSSPSSLFSNTSGGSSLSRSSSTCSLLSSTIKQQQHQDQQQQHQQQSFNKAINKSNSSSPALLNDFFLCSPITPPLGSSVSSNNSSLDSILPFNFCMQSSSPSLTKASPDLNSFSFGNNMNKFNKNETANNKQIKTEDFLGLGLENLTEQNQRYLLARDDGQWMTKLNKEFFWNINKLTEMVLLSTKFNETANSNSSTINGALANNFNLPSSCNINVNNTNSNLNSSNYGMNNNNMNNKLPRKIVGNSLSTPLVSINQQQTSPNMQQHPSVVNKYYSMNQPIQQQQQNMMTFNNNNQQQQPKMNNLVYQQNYNNQQFNLNSNNRTFGRIITNNRGYPQRVQC